MQKQKNVWVKYVEKQLTFLPCIPQLIYFLIHLTTPIMGGSHFACRNAPLPIFEVVYSASI